ncbi:MAG: hypothetical protein AABY00_02180 [Nanoarchaeota archaeon]
MEEQNKPLLYTSSEIKEDMLPRTGEDFEHLVLFRFEGGSKLIGSEILGATNYRGRLVNDGMEATSPPNEPILRIYQGLEKSVVRSLKHFVYKTHELNRRGNIDLDGVLRYIDRKVLKVGSKPIPLVVVHDKNWAYSRKYTPEIAQIGERHE